MPACDDAVARRAILRGAAQPSEHEGVSNRNAARANRNRIFLGISARIFVATPRNLQRCRPALKARRAPPTSWANAVSSHLIGGLASQPLPPRPSAFGRQHVEPLSRDRLRAPGARLFQRLAGTFGFAPSCNWVSLLVIRRGRGPGAVIQFPGAWAVRAVTAAI